MVLILQIFGIEAYRSNELWAYDIDYHRRKIKYFYRNLSQLLKYKYIKEDFAETVCSPKGSLLLEQVILPLDEKLDIPYKEKELKNVIEVIHRAHKSLFENIK